MSELGGSEWGDEGIEIPHSPARDLPSPEAPYPPERPVFEVGEVLPPDPDDWNELARDLRDSLETGKDTPFTGNELATVRSALHDAQKEIVRLGRVNDRQLALIESLSEQLSRSSEHIGKKDWIIMAIGAGTALVIAEVVPPAVLVPIGVKFFHAISHLFK